MQTTQKAPNITILTDDHLRAITQTLYTFPDMLVQFPYTLDDIVSRAVKEAAHPNWMQINGVWSGTSSGELVREMNQYLVGRPPELVAQLVKSVDDFIDYLIIRFLNLNIYHGGESPYRFVGYNALGSGTYDIVISCG